MADCGEGFCSTSKFARVREVYAYAAQNASVPGASKVLARPQRQLPPPTVTVTKYYYFGGQRVAMRKNGAVTWLHADHLGSASVTTNASGNKVAELRYKPFGEVRFSTGTLETNRKFNGNIDDGFGLLDYSARMYSPVLGRFLSPDSIIPRPNDPQSLNRFAYVRNNPLNRIDPSGHCDGKTGGESCSGADYYGLIRNPRTQKDIENNWIVSFPTEYNPTRTREEARKWWGELYQSNLNFLLYYMMMLKNPTYETIRAFTELYGREDVREIEIAIAPRQKISIRAEWRLGGGHDSRITNKGLTMEWAQMSFDGDIELAQSPAVGFRQGEWDVQSTAFVGVSPGWSTARSTYGFENIYSLTTDAGNIQNKFGVKVDSYGTPQSDVMVLIVLGSFLIAPLLPAIGLAGQS